MTDRTSPNGQAPPHDLIAERALIGRVLNAGEIPEGVGLPASDFYDWRNEKIWAAACTLTDQQKPCDMPSVRTYLDERKQLDHVHRDEDALSDKYLFNLVEAPPVVDPAYQARTIQERSRERKFQEALHGAQQRARESAADLETQLQELRDKLDHIPGPKLEPANGWSRWVDLLPYLEGTRVRPDPTVGGERDDGIQVLYPKRWHTNIALTGAGKTAFALWHARAILDGGWHVIYLHFEEPEPDGVIDRLISFGVDRGTIDKRFHWADCSKRWAPGEMAYRLTQFEESPMLAILDGINAACSLHDWVHGDPSAIGAYRTMFVTPLVKAGAAVLSLGHPPKARDRQNEIHGFGSTAWLDEVDGVGFRMVAAKEHPMVIGGKGYSDLYVVKDRYSQVKRWGNVDTTKDQPWYYMGAFIVDDTADLTVVRLNVPPRAGDAPKSKEAILAGHIVETLSKRTGRFESTNQLKGFLAEDGFKYTASHLPVALEMLASRDVLVWPEVANTRSARPGWLSLRR